MQSAWQTAAVSAPSPLPVSPADRPDRREIVKAALITLLRLFIGFWIIFGILSLVPDTPDSGFVMPFAVALLLVVLYVWFFKRQLGAVYHAQFPTLRAAEALVLIAAMFLALFAMGYVMISLSDATSFTEPLDPFTSYYFSLTVLATVGFGDITPVTTLARSVTMVQMALDLVFVAVLIRVVGTTARRALDQRHQTAALPTTAQMLGE